MTVEDQVNQQVKAMLGDLTVSNTVLSAQLADTQRQLATTRQQLEAANAELAALKAPPNKAPVIDHVANGAAA